MAIPHLSSANTFGAWLSTTQELVTLANAITDGPYVTANTELRLTRAGTSLNVSTNALVTGNLTIGGSIPIGNIATARINTITGNAVNQIEDIALSLSIALS